MERPTKRRSLPLRAWGQIFLILLVLAGLVLLARTVPVERVTARLTNDVDALGVWGPLAFAGLFVLLTIFFLPATPVTVACGAVFGPVLGTAVVSLGSTASATASFLFSRYAAHSRTAARIHRYPKLDAVYRALGGPDGWKLVAAIRLSHALPFGLQNLLFGVSPIRFLPFVVATWAAMLPGTILYVYFGSLTAAAVQEGAGAEPPAGPREWAFRAAGLVAAGLAVLYVAHLGRRIIREKAHVDLKGV
jgi:uncharacterized membrane protein YdjX (TVP38/TMEM64 family)